MVDDDAPGEAASPFDFDDERFEVVMDAVQNPLFATDRRGYLSYGNERFSEQFGYEPAVQDVHVSEFVVDADVEVLLDQLREMVSDDADGDDRRSLELDARTHNGRHKTFEASIVKLPDDDGFVGIAVVLHDISARQRREAVFSVMDRALRHNLRSNVSVIMGYTEVLEAEVGDEHASTVAEIRDAAEWIQELGTSFRTVQQAIEESFAHDETVSVRRVVESAVDSAQRADGDVDVSVHVAADGEFTAGPPVDHAVEHVVENAIVHNDADDPAVEVWVAHADRDGWVDIHVADNGPGIPDLERDIILGEVSVDQLQHGSGIGLWITRWVVEVFDGELSIADNEPRGTVVTMRFPLSGDAPAGSGDEPSPSPTEHASELESEREPERSSERVSEHSSDLASPRESERKSDRESDQASERKSEQESEQASERKSEQESEQADSVE